MALAGIEKSNSEGRANSMKRIGILTFHRAYNCGAVLQAWALQNFIEQMGGGGYVVSLPDCNDVGIEWCVPKLWRRGIVGKTRNLAGWCYLHCSTRFVNLRRHLVFARFCKKFLHIANGSLNDYDLVVVGSDQVWNPHCAGERNMPLFLGENVDSEVPMIGYALSGGDSSLAESWQKRLTAAATNRFLAISYREAALREQVKVAGPVVCDPTLLLARDAYRKLEFRKRIVKEPCVFAYVVNDANQVVPKAMEIARALGLRLFVADVYRNKPSKDFQNDSNVLPPDKFLAHMRDAEYVIVSSFHGCVFSLLYHKKFVCLYGEKEQSPNGRQSSLLAKAGVSDRRFSCEGDTGEIVRKLQTGYTISPELDKYIAVSQSWLTSTIEKESDSIKRRG